jgi:hypothetical protein
MKAMVVGALAVAALSSPAAAAETIYYGSRVGMEVTVTSKSGIGSENAVIRAAHTRENAKKFCLEYARDDSEKCVRDELAVPLSNQITADCKTGVFTTFNGQKLKFAGHNKGGAAYLAKYRIIDLPSGKPLDGTEASGYPVDIAAFIALCPGLATPE